MCTKHIGTRCEFGEFCRWPRITTKDDRMPVCLQTVGETGELGLAVDDFRDLYAPIRTFHYGAVSDLSHRWVLVACVATRPRAFHR